MNLDKAEPIGPDAPPLAPGDWTPTGWGAQHRVRRSDEQWTELVCHTADEFLGKLVLEQRCQTSRINRTADETTRCDRCSALPDLGPLVRGPVGEVRVSPDGLRAVCSSAVVSGGRRWRVVGEDPVPGRHGWRTDWDVARWRVVGNVYDLGEVAR